MKTSRPERASPADYGATVEAFLASESRQVLGELTHGHSHEQLDKTQIRAWELEIEILKEALPGLSGSLYLEFSVPRLGSRIDAVLVSGPALFPIEFKCGEQRFTRDAYNQAWDYALDLKNFHLGSHQALILPMVVATDAPRGDHDWAVAHTDGVFPPRRCSRAELGNAIRDALSSVTGVALDPEGWGRSAYQPTPTIIEAARTLYARHTVAAITRNDAGARNLTVTSSAVEEIVERTRANNEKAIVFLTGVPGAGKTLVGLNVATQRRNLTDSRAVFLSGNGPLVAVLQEALTRDEMRRVGNTERKGAIKQKVKPFIQNVHHFRDEGLRTSAPPFDHVAIFDEAQRAWNQRKTATFMKQRKGLDGFTQSEPEFLLSYLDRHNDWAVILCLVGGGQEINDGEAGIAAWCQAIESSFPHWRSYLSPELSDSEYAAAAALGTLSSTSPVTTDQRLHLSTSMRSFRSEKVSAFVKAMLDCDDASARAALADVALRYPIVVTRDFASAKAWVRSQARGSEQFGLVASSQAQRLKPLAVDVRVSVDPIHWFLGPPSDTRSSYYLEDAATEFQVQGLEVDWACVAWDADLRLHDSGWRYHSFRGDSWINVHNEDRRRYLLNAYRVLLTRARQGMAIFVPTGDATDPTRRPEFYDETFGYLTGLGLRTL